MKHADEDASNEQRMDISGQEAVELNPQNDNANVNVLDLHRGASCDILEEGYGKAGRSKGIPQGPCDRNGHANQSLADLIGSR